MKRVLVPEKPLAKSVARSLAKLEFSEEDKARLNELAAKSRAGHVSADERREIDAYSWIGSLISIVKVKADSVLKPDVPAKRSRPKK